MSAASSISTTASSQSEGLSLSQKVTAASVGAAITSLMMTPFDVVKTRLQAQQKPSKFSSMSSLVRKGFCVLHPEVSHSFTLQNLHKSCVEPTSVGSRVHSRTAFSSLAQIHTCTCFKTSATHAAQNHLIYNGSIDVARKIVVGEGVSRLWSGLSPALLMAVPSSVIYYCLQDHFLQKFGYSSSQPSGREWVPPLTGALSRLVAGFIVCPLELVRTRLQLMNTSYADLSSAVKHSVRTDGLLSLWRGIGPTMLRDVPFSGIFWMVYEAQKRSYMQLMVDADNHLPFAPAASFGAVSGLVAGLVTLPFDVVKTHRQIELGDLSATRFGKSPSVWKSLRDVYHQRGASGLFSGAVPRLAKVAPACAVMIGTYEFLKLRFSRKEM